MPKKYKKIAVLVLMITLFSFAARAESQKNDPAEEEESWIGKPEKEFVHSCAHICMSTYEGILLLTAVHFIHEINTSNQLLELKILKEIGQGFYKVTVELVKYSKTTIFSQAPLLSKAKRVCGILGAFYVMKHMVKSLLHKQKTLKADKTVSK